jgi:hypothetical protein
MKELVDLVSDLKKRLRNFPEYKEVQSTISDGCYKLTLTLEKIKK